jgi:ribonuclease P protein component
VGSRGALAPAEEGTEAAHGVAAIEARRLLTATARLPRAHRLARATDIRRCLTQGRRRRFGHLEMIWTDNLAGHPRMGLIVPRFQSSAVARTRLRRRIREIWRRELPQHQPAWALVIRARREAYADEFAVLKESLLAWRRTVLEGG